MLSWSAAKKVIQVGKQHGKHQKESALLTGSQGLTATSFLRAGWGKHLPRNNRCDRLQSLERDGTKVRPSCDSFASCTRAAEPELRQAESPRTPQLCTDSPAPTRATCTAVPEDQLCPAPAPGEDAAKCRSQARAQARGTAASASSLHETHHLK